MISTEKIKADLKSPYGLLFLLIAAIRLFFNAVIPLTDKTEARYGEIARLMAETGNWIVPQIDYGIPFWAKPPLSTWLSAASIALLGNSEFVLRLPYWIVAISMALMLSRYASKKEINFFVPGLILLTLPEFFLHAGVVSTDMMLSFSIALTMLGFWEFMHSKNNRFGGFLFFVGIGLGLLAKGPIVGILSFPPLFLWCLRYSHGFKKIAKLPWLLGGLVVLFIALPWYLLMEKNSPGFIDYFVVGEHFLRFLDSSWSGDKYGFPKQQPLGIVWLFLLGGTLPWSIAMIVNAKKLSKGIWNDPWRLFLWLWLLWTPFFFTFSKSLIHTYTLPVMVPLALLILHHWEELKDKKTYGYIAVGIPLVLFAAYFSKPTQTAISNSTDKYLVLHPQVAPSNLYALSFKSYSSQYYSEGKIKLVSMPELEEMVQDDAAFGIIIQNRHLDQIQPKLMEKFKPLRVEKKDALYYTK